ncbi:hypothetical protein [Novosphingobium album (ex Liu et al. 2023)]|uniref:Uncharacterized protein n=1 Tax=Novosphingobium album (ex Liu et al. 2023) TaxID=3031130 RepID=A0ABT5WTK2_9SPHN|nr:hypothetical protein [Novosphingobium album (ex Liu et al. 2023)]MDE8653222.1 hypothetical protein [Novosphingobium album (ex Liu et al. 2023)]
MAAMLSPVAAAATPNISTQSAVYVERQEADRDRRLEPAARLSRGDRVVTIVSWYRMGGDGSFVITNPLPARLAYQESARENQEVSVDGGRTWGKLEDLRIGSRMATPEDVTHVRWRISALTAARGSGHIAYSGIVR